jgi:hypothetical protein
MAAAIAVSGVILANKAPEKLHLMWLNVLLWGGVVALALEHVAHEEIVPYPPFLSAMSSPADTATMLGEMATIGTAMLLACIAVWVAMVLVYNHYAGTAKQPVTTQTV